MHCSPEQVDELLAKLRKLQDEARKLGPFDDVEEGLLQLVKTSRDAYGRGISNAIKLVEEIFGAK